MFNKFLLPIASCVSVGGVAVGFSKYNIESPLAVNSLLETKNKQIVGKIDSLEEPTTEYFYSLVESNANFTNAANIQCKKAVPTADSEKRFPCVLFDLGESKNSSTVITGIQDKINAEPSTLSFVTSVVSGKYYLLRTQTAIDSDVKMIAIYKDGQEVSPFALQDEWEKNIQYNKSK